jgi:mannosyl-oligosaccharide alpha-1,2-mannosidase
VGKAKQEDKPIQEEKPKDEKKPSSADKEPALPVKAGPEEPNTIAAAPPKVPETTDDKDTVKDGGLKEDIHAGSPPGRQDPHEFATPKAIHWEPQTEHFPVPEESIIQLPTGIPVKFPQIQYTFKEETADVKALREKRQSKIRDEFKKAWGGYKKKAWMHDELSPVSGGFRDPFSGWAATLVDSLDTLWIMGLEDEFKEAAEAVDQIDFTISARDNIQLFETTIRYLGGLVGAYDVSGQKYKNLLKKAEELATVLLGAFDTPNRMPILYYQWKPAFASQPHRASQQSNLAELGSLSLEFTRLAQLTKNPRYYDAVARVSEALEEFQNRTKVPGLFPHSVDASGCNKTVPASHELSSEKEEPEGYNPHDPKDAEPSKESEDLKAMQVLDDSKDSKASKGSKDPKDAEPEGLAKRDIAPRSPSNGLPSDLQKAKNSIGAALGDWDCRPGGLESSNLRGSDRFSMGGNQDSTYEYFPKVRKSR